MAAVDMVPSQITKQVEAGESNFFAHESDYQEEQYNLPPGYRFSPNAKELIMHYLVNKILGKQLPADIIREIDLYAYDPQQLPIRDFKYGKPDEAYFFTCLRHSKRQKRRTNSGYWKTTGTDKSIMYGNTVVGLKKILVFYQGNAAKGMKSSWIMHEFRVNPIYFSANIQDNTLKSKVENYVVCKIHHKQEADNKKKRSTSKYSKAKKTSKLAAEPESKLKAWERTTILITEKQPTSI